MKLSEQLVTITLKNIRLILNDAMQFFKGFRKHLIDIFLDLNCVILELPHLLCDSLEPFFNSFFLLLKGIIVAVGASDRCRVGVFHLDHVVVDFTSPWFLHF